jgi:hypothetical protein
MLVLEAWLTVRDLPLLVAVIANVLAVVSLIIGAHRLAVTLFIIAATLALYSLLDWLTRDRKPQSGKPGMGGELFCLLALFRPHTSL